MNERPVVVPARGPHLGVVATFDPVAGYGTVVAPDGSEWWFHCTAIADGSRRVDVGAPGVFSLVPGRAGRWEATGLAKI
jgi:cold shock CspA family protein